MKSHQMVCRSHIVGTSLLTAAAVTEAIAHPAEMTSVTVHPSLTMTTLELMRPYPHPPPSSSPTVPSAVSASRWSFSQPFFVHQRPLS